MESTALDAAVDAFRKAEAEMEARRDDLHVQIRRAYADGAGMKQGEIVRKTGYTRETIRRITSSTPSDPSV
ncbi:hypothetical protein ACIA8K_06925 [Catenuloplanes sp. NPDC051500]|uniref:hypothetical protein n=1 Tax=Catenuloplanes sp. NPDC051500 TaxID=3363959 RepID=UPI0037B8A802